MGKRGIEELWGSVGGEGLDGKRAIGGEVREGGISVEMQLFRMEASPNRK